jgi:HD-like signal output (HDOD) protein
MAKVDSMQARILFVDDDRNVLMGLRRMLHPMRQEWDMEFVSGGADALEQMGRREFDVVVTELRMPGLNGHMLLNEVATKHPQVVRLVLSGETDRDAVIHSVEPAHQYLSKPCDPELLKDKVWHACALHHRLANPSARAWVSSLVSLPSPPALYVQLLSELQAESCSAARVGELVARDAGMTAKILQLVNSAFFGVQATISDPVEAVKFLGLDTIGAVALSTHVFSQCSPDVQRLQPQRLWSRSVATSRLARAIVRHERGGRRAESDAFAAGLLHVSGMLALASSVGDRYRPLVAQATHERRPLWECERAALDVDYPEAGAYLLALWGLPDAVVDAVRWHHRPEAIVPQAFSPLVAVHAACALSQPASGELMPVVTLDEACLTRLNLMDHVPAWKRIGVEAIDRASHP